MKSDDEPLFEEVSDWKPGQQVEPPVAARIRRLVTEQPFAVLCTQGQGQPYGSLVAFSFSEDLSWAVFSTPVATRKYRLLSENDHVALVVDSRPDHAKEMMKIEAATATGCAREIEPGEEFSAHAGLLTQRHPQLASFVNAPSCALFRIDVFRFFHVVRFQEVKEWVPEGH